MNRINHSSRFIAHFLNASYDKKRLGEVCCVISGKTIDLALENEGGPIAYLKVADLNLAENDRVVTASSRYVSEQTALTSGLVPIGATIFPKNGAAALHNKKRITSIITCVDMNTMAVYSKSDTVKPEYLYAFLESRDLATLALVGAIPQIRAKDVQALMIPVPNVEEQEEYITMMHQADKSKFNCFKSRFIEMFGGNGSSAKWPKARLTDIVNPECPISYGIVQPDDDVKDGVPIVRPVDLNAGLYVKREGLKCTTPEISNAYKRTILRGEELLLCVRGTTGLMGIATEELKDANVTRGITPLFFKPGINRFYVLGAFLSDEIQSYIKEHTIGSTLKGINMEKVRKIEIPVPPITLQNKYEQIFKQADKSKFV